MDSHIIENILKSNTYINYDISSVFNIGNLNPGLIGFMIYDERYKIIYKTKDLKMSSNKRIKKGHIKESQFTIIEWWNRSFISSN